MAARKTKIAGAELADDLWEQLEDLIPADMHEEAAARMKEVFEEHDASDMDDSIISRIAGGDLGDSDDDEDEEEDEDESDEDEEDEDD